MSRLSFNSFLKRFIFLGALVANACGGGGGAGGDTPSVPHRLDFGYYLSADTQPAEVYNHTTIAFLGGPVTNESELLTQAANYSNLGIRRFIVNLIGITPTQAESLLPRIEVFGEIIAIYPIDEPNINGCDRTILAKFRTLGYKLFTIYAPQKYGFQCVEYFDILGLDDYEADTKDIFSEVEALGIIRPTAQLVLVPGGASPWKADPQPYLDYAKSHQRIIGIIPFLWFTPQGSNLIGIKDNGMAQHYIDVGKQIIDQNKN